MIKRSPENSAKMTEIIMTSSPSAQKEAQFISTKLHDSIYQFNVASPYLADTKQL